MSQRSAYCCLSLCGMKLHNTFQFDIIIIIILYTYIQSDIKIVSNVHDAYSNGTGMLLRRV